jgi:anti-anti-sigma factor
MGRVARFSRMERLRANVTFESDRVELELHGDLDADGADVLQALVAEFDHIDRIDLADVDVIDSSGLFALVQADTRARQAGTRLILVPPGAVVARIFAWTGLESRLHFV